MNTCRPAKVLVKLVNLQDYAICVHRMTKSHWDLPSSTRCVIPAGDWDLILVRPGMDVDRLQTILAITPLQMMQSASSEAVHGGGVSYDLFEVGVAQTQGLFFRRACFRYDKDLNKTSYRRRYDLVSEACAPLCLDEVGTLFTALLVPIIDNLCNVVELVFDEEYQSSSSAPSASDTPSSVAPTFLPTGDADELAGLPTPTPASPAISRE